MNAAQWPFIFVLLYLPALLMLLLSREGGQGHQRQDDRLGAGSAETHSEDVARPG